MEEKKRDGRNKLQGGIEETDFLYKGNKWDKLCFLGWFKGKEKRKATWSSVFFSLVRNCSGICSSYLGKNKIHNMMKRNFRSFEKTLGIFWKLKLFLMKDSGIF